ncbi:Murein DD-endopeptidase MepM [Candidatus Brocadiaceae bacterium]|nr:Murein DD-endopeptidase MepM [Candidatus Brocadiaceae bacterium]
MKQTFYASLFIGLGLTFAAAPTIAKTAQPTEKKQASAKTVKSDSKKTATPTSVAKKTTPSKKPDLAKTTDKHDKASKTIVNTIKDKHNKKTQEVADNKNNKYSKNTVRDNPKDKLGKKTPEVADTKDYKRYKKASQLVDAKTKTAKDSKKDTKHDKSKNQQIAEDKHSRKKSHQALAKTEQQEEDMSVAETNEAIETNVEESHQTESEQTAVYESVPQTNNEIMTNDHPPVMTPPPPLFSEPSAPVQNNSAFFGQNKPIEPPRPIQPVAPVQNPLISAPSKIEPKNVEPNNNNQRIHTSINKGSEPQIFSNNDTEEPTNDDLDETESSALPNNRLHNTITSRPSNFISDANTQETSSQIASTHGVVEGSLAEAGARAGLSEDMMVELTEIFAWDINFANNLQAGDQFTLVYDKNATGNNRIVAAEFINRGKTYRAIRYKSQEGMVSYYAPDGHSLRKAFLTTPVDFAKVSSHFSTHRRHPILNRIRAHKGVDYAARTGTPVKAAGDGVVTFHGTQGGYGNMIVIAHGEHYETAYAHLSNFRKGLQDGEPVKQGDVIGYVGQSGLATGPHLHYEFRVDGQHRDPEKLDSSQGMRLAGDDWDNFHAQTVPVLLKLNAAKTNNVVAENQPNRPTND